MKRSLSAVALFFAVGFILTTGCQRPEDEIGLQLQPQGDLLQADMVDTFTVSAFTVLDDSIRTDKVDPAMVGAYHDAIFGLVESGHVTELRLSSINPDFVGDSSNVDDIVVDSVVLALRYSIPTVLGATRPYYGNGLRRQYFQVFEITDSLSVDSAYYDFTPVNYIAEDLVKPGYNYQWPRPFSNVVVGADTLPPQVRLPLREELGYRFIEASADGELTNTEFVSLFKGIYIKVDEAMASLDNTSLLYFDTFTGDSRIVMYYHDTNTGDDSLRYSFLIRSGTGKFNKPGHNYNSAQRNLSDQLAGNYESAKHDLYIQSAAGLKLEVRLPYIQNLADSTGVAINKANLIVPARDIPGNQSIGSVLNPPAQLFIFGRNADGTIYQLSDDQVNTSGLYDATTNSYTFVISRYLQQILLGQRENNGLEIVSIAASRTANRVLLNGPDYPSAESPSNNLKLAITFTKY